MSLRVKLYKSVFFTTMIMVVAFAAHAENAGVFPVSLTR